MFPISIEIGGIREFISFIRGNSLVTLKDKEVRVIKNYSKVQ